MSYQLAPSLVKLRNQVNAEFKSRSKKSDGWIGDASHGARKSDHNPDYDAPGKRKGVVRALDITDVGKRRDWLVANLIRDPRVEYVIDRGRIWSRTKGWRTYTGSNPHNTHTHVSLRHTEHAETAQGNWLNNYAPATGPKTPTKKPAPAKPGISLSEMVKQANAKKPTKRPGTTRVQRLLTSRGYNPGKVDGFWGVKTTRAYARWQRKLGYTGNDADGIPGKDSLTKLVKGSSFAVHK